MARRASYDKERGFEFIQELGLVKRTCTGLCEENGQESVHFISPDEDLKADFCPFCGDQVF